MYYEDRETAGFALAPWLRRAPPLFFVLAECRCGQGFRFLECRLLAPGQNVGGERGHFIRSLFSGFGHSVLPFNGSSPALGPASVGGTLPDARTPGKLYFSGLSGIPRVSANVRGFPLAYE